MYARVVNVEFKPDQLDEARRIVNDAVVPVLKQQKGFKSQLLLIQKKTKKAISINLWETEADLVAFEKRPLYREVLSKLATVLAAQPESEAYDVSIQV
jgi:heme-degrading monooxygenase HmoA